MSELEGFRHENEKYKKKDKGNSHVFIDEEEDENIEEKTNKEDNLKINY